MKNRPYKILVGALAVAICGVVIAFCGFGAGFGVKLNEKSDIVEYRVSDLKAEGDTQAVKAKDFDGNYVLSDITSKTLRGVYRKFIAENCPDCKVRCFADVTGDGVEELILINQNKDKTVTGYVYSYANSIVFLLEEKHVEGGRNFGWYLKEYGDGYCLCEETFSKNVALREYTLNLKGERNIINEYSFEYTAENLPEIKNTFSNVLKDYMRIYATITCAEGENAPSDKAVFG